MQHRKCSLRNFSSFAESSGSRESESHPEVSLNEENADDEKPSEAKAHVKNPESTHEVA